jgi:HSP20 family protein
MALLTRLHRWDPVEELEQFRSRMDQALHRFGFEGETPLATSDWVPRADILETKDAIMVRAELPGVKQEDIEVELENRMLTIEGEKKFKKETEEENYHRVERSYGRFVRTFTLPQNADPDHIIARFDDGVLEVEIPKLEGAKPKQIQITGKSARLSA